jgi:uncharacterized damage-inducible protein DinB
MCFRILLLGSLAMHLFISSGARAQTEPIVPKTLQAGLLARFDESTSKVLQLGEAIPAEKYSWRPAPGVRSISEVLIHIALGNYYTTSDAGAKPTIKVSDEAERTITSKTDVLAFLRASITHMRTSLNRLTPEELEQSTTMFGQSTNYQNVYLFGISHLHEHLGQLIAYARMNGVAPPWSRGH